MQSIYILGGKRTPIGSFLGSLSKVPAVDLGATAIKGSIDDAKVAHDDIDQVYMGQVIQAGTGQAPARQAAIKAGLPESVPCTTINKVCGSGLEAVLLGSREIALGDSSLVIAGGMENMSMAPHLLLNSRDGKKFGEMKMKDSMQWDGLWDVYSDRPMGSCAEECAKKYLLSRESQDQFSMESFSRSKKAQSEGHFKDEITSVKVPGKKGDTIITEDEGPGKANFDKMPSLKPAFEVDGTITAANASTINDGGAAVVLGSEHYKSKAKFEIIAYSKHAQNPTWFTTAPVEAMKKCIKKASLNIKDIDLFEINEAFALVTMVAIKELELDPSKVNVFGGAVSLGHPIGCSGTRILITLMNSLNKLKKNIGMSSICIGGGEALSMIIKRI